MPNFPNPSTEQMADETQLLQMRNFSPASIAKVSKFFLEHPVDQELLRRLGQRWTAATFAFMAGGMWNDGRHNWPTGSFHRLFFDTRNSTESSATRSGIRLHLLQTALDLITALDRVSGGATLLMHIDGNLPPGHHRVPEAVKVKTYVTPHIMQEIPNGDIIVAQLTQTFVESIALPSIERWERAMENNGITFKYSFLNRTEVPRYNYENPPSLVLSPSPYTSSLYSICGRPVGALDDAIKFHRPSYVASQPTAEYEAMKIARDQAQDDCNEIQAMLLQAQAKVVKLETQLAEKERVLAASEKRLSELTLGLSAIEEQTTRLLRNTRDGGPHKFEPQGVPRPQPQASTSSATPSAPTHTSKQEDPGRFYFDSEPILPPRYVPLTSSPSHASDDSDAIVPDDSDAIVPFGPACDAAIERYGLEPRLNVELWMYYNELSPENWYEHLCIHSRLELYEALAMTIAMHADRGIDFDEDRCTTPSVLLLTSKTSLWYAGLPQASVSVTVKVSGRQMDDDSYPFPVLSSYSPVAAPRLSLDNFPPWTALELSDALPDSALFAGPNSLRPISSEPSLLPAGRSFDVHPFAGPGGFNLLLDHPAPLFDETTSTQVALEDALLPNSSTHQEHSSEHAPAVLHNGELEPGTSSGVHDVHNVVPNTDSNARDAHDSVREPPRNSPHEPVHDMLRKPVHNTVHEPVHDTVREPSRNAKLAQDVAKERNTRKDSFDADFDMLLHKLKQNISELANKHHKKEAYVENLIFNGGTRYLNENRANSWNAWLHLLGLAFDNRIPLSVVQRDYMDEYRSLTEQEKDEYVREYQISRNERKVAPRVTARGKHQDVTHTTRKIEQLIMGLDSRVGIQGMFCLVRNSASFAMDPRWFFTSPELEKYLEIAVRKWDTTNIGALIEAYAIAGGSVTSALGPSIPGYQGAELFCPDTLRTAKMKANWLKTQIRAKITAQLSKKTSTYLRVSSLTDIVVELTGNPSIKMNYVNFEEQIVQRYGLAIVGWPANVHFVNPSDLSDSLPPLQGLCDALTNGSCKFVRLTAAEVKARRERVAADVAAGTIAPRKARKPRKDAGVPRRSRKSTAEDENGGEESLSSKSDGGDDGQGQRAPRLPLKGEHAALSASPDNNIPRAVMQAQDPSRWRMERGGKRRKGAERGGTGAREMTQGRKGAGKITQRQER
ncbi:hypothetical protein BC835DRAFT_1303302 [Cytidiella melzeri]|nr:hypothetical protein BC835DRAFT_1303302 [Cytidiella melzeri]